MCKSAISVHGFVHQDTRCARNEPTRGKRKAGELRNFYVDLSIADFIKLRFPVKIGRQLGYV